MSQQRFSSRCPAVKRLMKEAQELSEPTSQYYASPLDDNLFEWHFTFRGPSGSEYEGGVYHGRITFPPEYPMKPPSIMLLTPTGRFKIAMNICLSISGHHPETWQPSWSIRTVLLAIMGFMPTHGGGAIGSLDYTPEERKVLAKRSKDWQCPVCKVKNKNILPEETSQEKAKEMQQEAAKVVAEVQLTKQKFEEEIKTKSEEPNLQTSTPGTKAESEVKSAVDGVADLPDGESNTTAPTSITSSSVATPSTLDQSTPDVQPTTQATSLPSTSPPQQSSTNPPLVRRRPGANTARTGANPATESVRPVGQQQQGSNRVLSLVIMIFLGLAIFLLIIRRIYITYEYKFDTEL
ncbi:ubiquitin-conjugating enzyme E2 J1-like [Antedon mediterranea]|uniref:ubiquitin-conjugating enzyme E2 J1-like n=1 Tax=Antedon mediterranea TaxID=105859 RepID=UPI003AF48C3E